MIFFKLINKATNLEESLNVVDEKIKRNTKAYDRSNNEKYAFAVDGYQSGYDDHIDFLQDNLSWYIVIGFRLACAMSFDEIIEELETLAASYDKELDKVTTSILNFLKSNYDVECGYSVY